MEVDFSVHDTFGLTRPQWQFASSLEEAAAALQLALSEQQKTEGVDKTAEIEDGSLMSDSEDDDNHDAFILDAEGDVDEEESLSEDDIPEVRLSCPTVQSQRLVRLLNTRRMHLRCTTRHMGPIPRKRTSSLRDNRSRSTPRMPQTSSGSSVA